MGMCHASSSIGRRQTLGQTADVVHAETRTEDLAGGSNIRARERLFFRSCALSIACATRQRSAKRPGLSHV